MALKTLINFGTVANDHTGDTPRAGAIKLSAPFSKTYVATAQQFGGATKEATITNTIAAAVADGANAVLVPQKYDLDNSAMLPYNASLVTFNNTVQIKREGGDDSVYDVWAYGANHNGSGGAGTDDQPAIQAAINAAVAASINTTNSKMVFLPPGQYVVKSNILLTAAVDIVIRGAGRNETLVTMGANGVTLFQTSGVCTRVRFEDLWIGSFVAYTTGGGLQSINPGYPLTPTSDLSVQRCAFENLPNPIYYDNVSQWQMENVVIKQTVANATVGSVFYMIRSVSANLYNVKAFCTTGAWPGHVIDIDADCDTILCHRCEIVLGGNGTGNSYYVHDSVGGHPPRIIRFTDCTGENSNSGFVIASVRDGVIAHCETANAVTSGVTITGGVGVKVLAGQHFLNKQHGIVITGGTGVVIEGNVCSDNSQQTDNTYSGIWSSAVGARIVNNISGNVFFGALAAEQKNGIDLEAGADFCLIAGNDLRSNKTAAYADNSAGANHLLGENTGIVTYGIVGQPSSDFVVKNAAQTASRIAVKDSGRTTINDGVYAGVGPVDGAVATKYRSPAVLFQGPQGASTTSTIDVSITSFTMLGNTLGTASSGVRIRAGGRESTQAGSFNIKFGATVLFTITPGAGGNFYVDVTVTRAGATVQVATGITAVGATVTSVSAVPGETLSGSIVIDFRGSVTAGGTLNLDTAVVEYLSAL